MSRIGVTQEMTHVVRHLFRYALADMPLHASVFSIWPPRRCLFLRIVHGLVESNRREAERKFARYIARNGGRFTDPLESNIAQWFGCRR